MSTRRRPAPIASIETDEHVRRGVRSLRRKCAIMRHVHDLAGDPPLRRRTAGFEGLARIIVGQQVSVASANAIWARCAAAFKPFTPQTLAALDDAALQAAGLSRPKVRTFRAIIAAVESSELPLDDFGTSTDEEIHAALCSVKGIGPWTADIYLMFCLGRPDAFAPGDLALQVAAQHAFGRAERPTADELAGLAETWRPWRGVSARLLWAYHAAIKDRASQPV